MQARGSGSAARPHPSLPRRTMVSGPGWLLCRGERAVAGGSPPCPGLGSLGVVGPGSSSASSMAVRAGLSLSASSTRVAACGQFFRCFLPLGFCPESHRSGEGVSARGPVFLELVEAQRAKGPASPAPTQFPVVLSYLFSLQPAGPAQQSDVGDFFYSSKIVILKNYEVVKA